MSETTYSDYLPANARINITYGKEDKVTFGYPIAWTYEKALWKRAYGTVLGFWLWVHMLPFMYLLPLMYLGVILRPIFFPKEVFIEASSYTVNYLFVLPWLAMVGVIVYYFFGIPALFIFLMKKHPEELSKLLPKLGYLTAKMIGREKEKIFIPSDVHEKKVCIPNFSNVYLNYKTEGDFNTQLESINIVEIPFTYNLRKSFFRKAKEINDFEWQAIFTFKEPPKDGRLITTFH